jgi:hypothetical protein
LLIRITPRAARVDGEDGLVDGGLHAGQRHRGEERERVAVLGGDVRGELIDVTGQGDGRIVVAEVHAR